MTEKANIKNLFSQTAIYGVGLLINKALSFLLLPLYTYYFSPAEMGMFNLVQSLWLFTILIYLYGMETAFIKFFIDVKDEAERKKLYSTTLLLLTITSVIFSVIIYSASGGISALIRFDNPVKGAMLIKIMCFVLFFDTLFRFPLLLLRAELNAKLYLYLTLLSLVINIALNFILIIFAGYGVEAIFYSYIISVFATFIAGLAVTRKFLSFEFSFASARKLVIYGNKFIYIGLFTLLIDIADRFFLKYYYGEDYVGIYNANYRLASVMGLIIAAFRFAWTPFFLNLEKNPENKKIISEIFTYLVFSGLLLFLFFTFFTSPIVKISFGKFSLLDPRYQQGLSIVPPVLLAYLFSGLFSALNVAPFFANRTSYLLLIVAEGFIINTILNFILIGKYGMEGAAFSTLITYLLMFIHVYFVSQKLYRISYQWNKLSKLVLSASTIYLLSLLINIYVINEILKLILYVILISVFIIFSDRTNVVKLNSIKTIFTRHA